jgi:hypothetical protein
MSLTTLEAKMDNPWKEISSEKRVLDVDEKEVRKHNEKYKDNDERLISLNYFPEPFIGDPNAKIYLLLGNPGMEADRTKRIENYNIIKKNSDYYIKNLKHQAADPNFPLYYLHEAFKNIDEGGYIWWRKALGKLKNENVSFEKIAKSFFAVETYGYHSANGENKMRSLPSSQYSYHLVKKAIADKKLIIVTRAVSVWSKHVKELRDYYNCYFLASNMGIRLSETTLSPGAYKQVRSILEESK